MDEDVDIKSISDDPKQLFNQFDHRGFNLLMISAENGDSHEVKKLLSIGFDVNSSFGPHTAASLAYDNRHYETLLILLNENSKLPQNFNAESSQHADLIGFNELISHFYIHLFSENTLELESLIKNHRHLRYFYSINGHSAAFEALNNMIINCYELFVQNNILLSSDEDFNEAIEPLTNAQKEQVRVIHEKFAIPLPNNHLMIIYGSLFVGHDEAHQFYRLNTAQSAINYLNDIPQFQPILKLIVRAGGFKIIFDFNRESTQFINPTTGSETRGLFCTTRHIYIAAKNLLNEGNEMEVYGTMAHELTHFAIDLVYNNNCKPFKDVDKNTIGREFYQILIQCRVLKGVEEIIDLVWNYDSGKQFAELIVRVPQMLVIYNSNRVILNDRRMQFNSLFDFYESRVLPDIDNKIPTINAEMNQRREVFFDKTIKKVTTWRKTAKIAVSVIPLSIFIATLLAFLFVFSPDLKYSELSADDQAKVMDGRVKFMDINLKFHELYNQNNTHLLSTLSSNQLRMLIDGETLDLSEPLNIHLQDDIYLVYSNLTDELKAKLSNSECNFQGANITIKQIIFDGNSEILNALLSDVIREILTEKIILKIGEIQQNNSHFYVERYFIDYDTKTNVYGMELNDELQMNVWNDEILNYIKDFHEISSIADETKVFLLSDHAGCGKTTTFKHLAVKLKKKYPNYWVSYVDLKRHLNVYEQDLQVVDILSSMLQLIDKFEMKLFEKLFASNRVILLFDGVDEIAPKFNDFITKLFENVRESNNQQYIATRPQHMIDLKRKFSINAYKLLPFDGKMKFEFVSNVLDNDRNAKDILKTLDNSDVFINDIYIQNPYIERISTPLMLQTIAELYAKDKSIVKESNKYLLYEKIIQMKKEIVDDKGKIVSTDRDNENSTLNIWQVHQIYALKITTYGNFHDILDNDYVDIDEFLLIKKWNDREKSNWTPEAISRYGILIVDRWNDENEFPDFVHKTFAEFLVAKFLTQDFVSDDEVQLKVKLMASEAFSGRVEWEFIESYLSIYGKNNFYGKFLNRITNVQEMIDDDDFDTMKKFIIIKVLSLDEDFLMNFRSDRNETIFQMFFKCSQTRIKFRESCSFMLITIMDIYEWSLGSQWYQHIGYAVRKKIIPSDDEIMMKLSADFSRKDASESEDEFTRRMKDINSFYKLLFIIKFAEIPRDILKIYLMHNIDRLLRVAFHSYVLTKTIVEIIHDNYNGCEENVLEVLYNQDRVRSFQNVKTKRSQAYLSNIVLFLGEIEKFIKCNVKATDRFRQFKFNFAELFSGSKNDKNFLTKLSL